MAAVQQNAFSLERSTVPYSMRVLAVAVITVLSLVACRAADPLREIGPREDRLIALDSLSRANPCSAVRATVLFDSSAWTPAHACAVAARALQLFGATRAHEPYMAPRDTGRVTAMRVTRLRGCEFSGGAGADPLGRTDALSYVVEIEVPDRPHYIAVVMDAIRFAGGAAFDAHPRGVWGSSPHLTVPTEASDTLEAGAPCGQS